MTDPTLEAVLRKLVEKFGNDAVYLAVKELVKPSSLALINRQEIPWLEAPIGGFPECV